MSYMSGKDFEIIDAGVVEMKHLPDFGRIEARVSLMIRRSPIARPERAAVLTSVESRADESLADLRQRLAEDAIRLWHLTDKPGTLVPRQSYELPHAA